MAIIRFGFKFDEVPEGVDFTVQLREGASNAYGPFALYLWEEYKGLCLEDREMNYHDDSDFYMIVWDPETKSPRRIMFATTRGWSYPSYGSYVDATPEVVAEYQAHCKAALAQLAEIAEFERRAREDAARAAAAADLEARSKFAAENDLLLERVLELEPVVFQFLSKKIRSDFKKSLRKQIIDWCKQQEPKFRSPLSYRQIAYI